MSLLRRLFGGTPSAPSEAQTPAVPAPAPEIVITDENRADLLHLAQNAPLAYGYWAQVKRLYKAAEKAQDTTLLGALISRLDTAAFADDLEPLSTPFQEANAGPVVQSQVIGTTAYVLTQGSLPGLNIVDVSDPVLPRLLGKITIPQPVDVVVTDNRAYVIEGSTYQKEVGALHVVDVSQLDNPRALGKTEIKSAIRVALMGKYVLVVSNDYRTAALYIFDVTQPQNILTVNTIKLESPGDIAIENTTAYLLIKSLKFVVKPGEKPSIVVEPWNDVVQETEHTYNGSYDGEIRIWGRRLLLVMESLLPHADLVQVRLLGGGLPSYWTVFQKNQRFDLGLSGWTKNDWAQAARFDLLASTNTAAPDVAHALKALSDNLHLTPEALAAQLNIPRDTATSALQQCCAQAQAMYDHVTGISLAGITIRPARPARNRAGQAPCPRQTHRFRAGREVGRDDRRGKGRLWRSRIE